MYKNEGGIEFNKETNQNKIPPIKSTLSNHKIVSYLCNCNWLIFKRSSNSSKKVGQLASKIK